MAMFDKLLANLKASKKTIVFTEGTDPRILSAAEIPSSDLFCFKLHSCILPEQKSRFVPGYPVSRQHSGKYSEHYRHYHRAD